jgi:putative redox protein
MSDAPDKLIACSNKGALMVQIDISYQGQLRCQATHAPSGTTLLTDAPRDNQGKGESFSPTDLVATALGTCILTTMGILAQRQGINLEGTTVKVTKEMIADPLRRIARLETHIHIPNKLAPEDRQRLESAAHTCPVHKSLHPSVEAPIIFHWA